MEVPLGQPRSNGHTRLVADLPLRVIVALEHLEDEEQEGVLAAVQAFAHREMDGRRISGSEPLYILRAAPEVRVIVRREGEAPVEVVDIVRPATLRNFAHAQ